MSEVLTPEDIETLRETYDSEAELCSPSLLRRLCDSHEELRARLAAAEERLAMADSFLLPCRYAQVRCFRVRTSGKWRGWNVIMTYPDMRALYLWADGKWHDRRYRAKNATFLTLDAAFAAWEAAKAKEAQNGA